MTYNYDKLIINKILDQEIHHIFGHFRQVYRNKDNKCFIELYQITIKVDKLYFTLNNSIEETISIDEGSTLKEFTNDAGNYNFYNERIEILDFLDDWKNVLTGFGSIYQKNFKEQKGFYLEIDNYKKIYVLEQPTNKILSCSVWNGWQFEVLTSLPNKYFAKEVNKIQ